MARTIMVPLDGSTFAEHALPAALDIAKASGGRVHLVQTHEIPIIPSSPDILVPYDASWDALLREQEREYLGTVSNRIAERAGQTVRTELLDGVPAMVLATYAREMEVDLIVMTTHGRGGMSRLWLGSVADGVVRRSGVPVLLLRPTEQSVDLDAVVRPRHILVPLDGSDLSRGVLEPATWLGSFSDARYTLLRVTLPIPMLRGAAGFTDDGFGEKLIAEQETEAKLYLEAAATVLRQKGLEVETAVVNKAAPAGAILEFAATNAVDLIALATHGRGGWTRLALGSVADKVLRGAVMPVMLYRPSTTGDDSAHRRSAAAASAGEG